MPGSGLIDLHLHTTASDGLCSPGQLVDRAVQAGLTVMAVTDHDTIAAVAEVQAAARRHGLDAISGIEVTAVDEGRDIHVLGYFIDSLNEQLETFLSIQRQRRIARAEAMGARLAALGVPIDIGPLIRRARLEVGRSIGRPQLARAMVDAGHVADIREAFDRWLGLGCPAFVERVGPSPEAVIEILHEAGGVASLAHPGKMELDPRIPSLAEAGLDAIEAFHPDHDALLVERYVRIGRDANLFLTGGSDFHGDVGHAVGPGSVTLPAAEWARLDARRRG